MNRDEEETIIMSFNKISKDDLIYHEEMDFDGETKEERIHRKVIALETRKEREEQEYRKENKNRSKNGILKIVEEIMQEKVNNRRNKVNNKK